MGVKSNLAFLSALYRRELASALEYRFNFVVQTVGMVLNDAFWLLFWLIFFEKFGSVNGWQFKEIIMLNSVLAGSWGLTVVLFGNWKDIAKFIENGSLDYYLTLPKNVLLHLLVKMHYSGMGDLVYGLGLSFFVVQKSQILLFVLLFLSASLTILGFGILIGSITFYLRYFEQMARTAREVFLTFSFYPFSIYSGFTRFFLLFIIPAGFVGGIPVELLTSFSWKWFILQIAVSLFFFIFSIWFFYHGLKRYESGNVIAMKG